MKFKLGFTLVEMLVTIFLFSCFVVIFIPLTNRLTKYFEYTNVNEKFISDQLTLIHYKNKVDNLNVNITYILENDTYILESKDIAIILKIGEKIKINNKTYELICHQIIMKKEIFIFEIKFRNELYPFFIRRQIHEIYNA